MQACLPVAHCYCGRGLGAVQGPQKPEGSRCSEMHSQPYLRPFFLVCRVIWPEPNNFFFHGVRAQNFFLLIIRAQLFFQRISGHNYYFQFYTRPPPPPGYLMVNAIHMAGRTRRSGVGVATDCLLSLSSARVRMPAGAGDEVTSDLVLGDRTLQFPSPLATCSSRSSLDIAQKT